MKIKLISANFNDSRHLVINNLEELKRFNVDVEIYSDLNTPSRELSLHPRLKGKIPKMLEWQVSPHYDYYIWVDSKFTINDGFIEAMIEGIGQFDIAVFKHPYRSTIKAELDFMNVLMKQGDNYLKSRYVGENMNKQVETYLNDKSFVDNRLFAAGCFIYSKRLVINTHFNILKEWFFHNTIWSIQDQLSLPYLLQKYKIKYTTFDFNLLNSPLMPYN
jgi:hypothetical protein